MFYMHVPMRAWYEFQKNIKVLPYYNVQGVKENLKVQHAKVSRINLKLKISDTIGNTKAS